MGGLENSLKGNAMFKSISRRTLTTCCLAAALATTAVGYRALAADDDKMAKSGMMNDDMMKSEMMKMKDMMKDDSSKMAMEKQMAQTMTMMHMAMEMCKDGKCDMMMKSDPDMMKMMDEAKTMSMDPDKMKMMQDQIMKDPNMMHQVMMEAMAHSMMMKDMGGKMDDKMGGDKMK